MARVAQSTLAPEGTAECLNMHRLGYVCTRQRGHAGHHHAHAEDPMVPVLTWRGGKPHWPNAPRKKEN